MQLFGRALGIAMAVLAVFVGSRMGVQSFNIEHEHWKYDLNLIPCDTSTAGYPVLWWSCTVTVGYDPSLASQAGWPGVADYARSEWYAYDYQLNRLDFRYDYSGDNGEVLMVATDLGGPDPTTGKIYLGRTPVFSLYDGTGENMITSATVYITTNSAVVWCTSLTSSCPSGTFRMVGVMAHELGHALGLAHPVEGPLAPTVMECEMTKDETELVQADDRNGEGYLYSGRPSDFGSPKDYTCTYAGS